MKYSDIKWEDDEESFESENEGKKEDSSFAELLAQSDADSKPRQSLRVGAKVEGIIDAINPNSNNVLVELDPLHTGVIDKQDLLDDEGELKYRAGDTISAYVVSRQGGEILLSSSMSSSQQSLDDLRMASQSGLPVKGKVTGENKGGFDVTVMSKAAFCPVSQMDTTFVQSKAEYIGQEYEFLIDKVAEGGRNIVVSRSKLLRQQAEQKARELEERLSEDLILTGVVKEIRDYGAFVDIGGLDGFLHISELSYSRVQKVNEFLDRGDKVKVKVINIEEKDGKKRISLSMKAVNDDPWTTIAEDYEEGSSVAGKVTKLESFGAFVEIAPGVEGLIHISEMSWEKRIHHASDLLSVGDTVNVRILKIDSEQKRLSLSLKDIGADPWAKAEQELTVGSTVKGTVTNLKGFGALVEVLPGVTGMIPVSVLKKAFGESYRKEASPPKELDVQIKAVEREEKKVALGLPNVEGEDEANDEAYREYLNRKKSETAAKKENKANQRGSFGALLAAQLEKQKK